MKKWIVLSVLAALLVLTGCSALLERHYSVVEPYTDRYWDSSAEDTLKAENYQELVNSLLMLVQQRAEEGTIRCYIDQNPYFLASTARDEVCGETLLGSYFLEDMTFTYERGEGWCSLAFQMTYRQDAEELEALMAPLSDSQSLVDLLRIAAREGHGKLTARFAAETARVEIRETVEALWQELYLAQLPPEEQAPVPEEPTEETPVEEPRDDGETDGEAEDLPQVEIPPCPWELRFYPDLAEVEVVEILLKE